MKQALLILIFTFNISSAATQFTAEDGQLLSAVYTYISQIPLPDGMSVFGNYVPGSKSFDFEHMNDDGNSAYLKAVNLSELLETTKTSRKNREQRLKDIKESFDFLVAELYRLTPDAVGLFEGIFTTSKLYGTHVLIPKQTERASHYNKIARWRVFRDSRPDDALEAIRIERERLDAIAVEEEAKRKADALIKAAPAVRHHGEDDEHNASARDRLLPSGKLKVH